MKQWNPGEGGGPNTHLISMKRNKQIFVRFQLLRCLRCRIAAGYYSKDAESKCLGLSRKKRGRPHTPGCPLPLLCLPLLLYFSYRMAKNPEDFLDNVFIFTTFWNSSFYRCKIRSPKNPKSEVRKSRNSKS